MRRVLVIGCPGSGKSTVARALAERLGLPLIHLDRLYQDPGRQFLSNRPAWRRYVSDELVRRPAWIIDGHYPATLAARLTAADTVVHLDYPTWLCLLRAVRRRWTGAARPDMPQGWRERLSWSLLSTIVLFRRRETPRVRRLLAEAPGPRVVTLTNDRQVRAFLASPGPA